MVGSNPCPRCWPGKNGNPMQLLLGEKENVRGSEHASPRYLSSTLQLISGLQMSRSVFRKQTVLFSSDPGGW